MYRMILAVDRSLESAKLKLEIKITQSKDGERKISEKVDGATQK